MSNMSNRRGLTWFGVLVLYAALAIVLTAIPSFGQSAKPDLNAASLSAVSENVPIGALALSHGELAVRIVSRRDALHGFTSWAQVDSIKGVGVATMRTLQEAFRLSADSSKPSTLTWESQGYTPAQAAYLRKAFGRQPCVAYGTKDGKPC